MISNYHGWYCNSVVKKQYIVSMVGGEINPTMVASGCAVKLNTKNTHALGWDINDILLFLECKTTCL